MTIAEGLRALAERVPADGPPAVTLARQRVVGAAEAVTAALSTDPNAGRAPAALARRAVRGASPADPAGPPASAAIESECLSAAGASTAHLGRINPLAAGELDAVSARCPELAAQVAAEAWPDWNTQPRP